MDWEITKFYQLEDQPKHDNDRSTSTNQNSNSDDSEEDSEDSDELESDDDSSDTDHSSDENAKSMRMSGSKGRNMKITNRGANTSRFTEDGEMDIAKEPKISKGHVYRFRHQHNNLYSNQSLRKSRKIVRWSNKSLERKMATKGIRKSLNRITNTSGNVSVRTGSLTTIKADYYSPHLWIGLLLISYKNDSYYSTACLRIQEDSDYIGIVTTAGHLVKKTKSKNNKMILSYPKSITLFIQSGVEDFQEYELKVENFKIHQKYIKQFYSPQAYKVAVGVTDLNNAYPQIEDIEAFKKRLMSGMPKMARKYKHKKNDVIKMIWYPFSDWKEEHEVDGYISKVVKEDKSSGNIMYKDIVTIDRHAGAPVLKYHDRYGWHVIGVHLGEVLGKVEWGVIVTKTIKKWIENNINNMSKRVKRCSRFGKQIITDIDTVKV